MVAKQVVDEGGVDWEFGTTRCNITYYIQYTVIGRMALKHVKYHV